MDSPHSTPKATAHTRTIDIRLPADCSGTLVASMISLCESHNYSTQMHLLPVGKGYRMRLLANPTTDTQE